MLELLFRLIGFLITFPFKLIQLPFRLVLKVLISPRIKLWPSATKNSSSPPKKQRGKKISSQDRAVLDDIQAEIQHQKLHGAPRIPSSPKKRSPALIIFAILVIVIILIAFIFAGHHI